MSKTYSLSVNKNEIKSTSKSVRPEQSTSRGAKANYEIEKNLLSSPKKQIKENVSKVKSYADIVLGNKKKEEVLAKTTKNVTRVKRASKPQREKVVEKEKTIAKTIILPETDTVDRNPNVLAEVSERMNYDIEYDSDALRVINIARMGSLFDYLD